MTEEDSALPRKRDIEAAIAAHNATDRETALLPHSTARLLAVIFPRDNVCRRSEASLMADGFDARTLRGLLRALLHAGFLSRESGRRGTVSAYSLHLLPRAQP